MKTQQTIAALLLAALSTISNAQVPEPEWIEIKPVRKLSGWRLGNVLEDIESRMKARHGYAFPSEPMTWAHETTHGLHSEIRMKQGGGKVSAVYVLGGRAAILREPRGTLSSIAARIPKVLRGPSYDLYLIQQRRYWNNTPTYILDEWGAYLNGADCAAELREKATEYDWHYEVLQAVNFSVYALAMAQEVQEIDPSYDVTQLRAIVDFQASRGCGLLRRLRAEGIRGRNLDNAEAYLRRFLTADEAAALRTFAQGFLTPERFDEIFGK